MFEGDGCSYVRVPMRDLDKILSSRLAIVATVNGDLKGALISIWPRPPYAWLDALVAQPDACNGGVFDALLKAFEQHLKVTGVRNVLCSIEDGDDESVRLRLVDRGFRVVTRFLRYQKADLSVPRIDLGPVTVRPAMKKDLAALYRIEDACFEPPWRIHRATLKRFIDLYPRFSVACIGGDCVGFHYSTVDGQGTGDFIHVAVDPGHRGLNIGKLLLADAIEFFQAERASHVESRTESGNQAAQRLFAAFDFQLKGPHRDVLGKDLEASPD